MNPTEYARTRNAIDGAVSHLSPYITHGFVSLREVYEGVCESHNLHQQDKFVFELGWRAYFRHVWQHRGDAIFSSLHSGPLPDHQYSPSVPNDIRQAQTGVNAMDMAIRGLYETGSMHNHARMWLASYVVHLRHVHWRAGADWLLAHLLDGDLASNHLSWQWVAGTGSNKPYLFNADNVARYAPAHWHSAGSVIDQSYEALDQVARGMRPVAASADVGAVVGIPEPSLLAAPPADLELRAPTASAVDRLRGREVWLVHPWALRAAPADLPDDTIIIGVYPQEHHAVWPWPESRWRWVDAAMAAVAPERWYVGSACLAEVLAAAACVRSVDDPHLTQWLARVAQLQPAPALFPVVERRCDSFSQWWTRTTRGIKRADELLTI